MGQVVTITMECDRCSSGFHAEQVDLETAIRLQENKEAGDAEIIFLCRTQGSEVKYTHLCEGCKAVLLKKLEECGPIKRRQKGMGKGKPKGNNTKKATKGKGKSAGQPAVPPAE